MGRLASMVMIMLLGLSHLWAKEALKVGYFDKKPVTFQQENGLAAGIFIDIINEIAEKKGYEIEYHFGEFSEIFNRLQSDKIDLMVPLGYTEEREKQVVFSKEPVITSWGTVFTTHDSPIDAVPDVAFKTIAFVKNSLFYKEFYAITQKFEITCNWQEVDGYTEMFQGILAGLYDGGIGDRLNLVGQGFDIREKIDSRIIFYPFDLYAAASTVKGEKILEDLNEYLKMGKSTKASGYAKILNKWISGNVGTDEKIIKSYIIILLVLTLYILLLVLIRIPRARRQMGLHKFISSRQSINILTYSFMIAVTVWVTDALLEYFWFDNRYCTFLEILIAKNNQHVLFIRLMYFSVIFFGSIFISRLLENNIKEQKKYEDSAENLRTTLNSIGDAVITTDIAGRVVQMNPVAEKLTGWEFLDAHGKYLDEIFFILNAITMQKVESPVKRVLETGKIIGLANHTLLVSRDGQKYQIADSAAPIIDKYKATIGVVLVFRDVTDEYALQEKLRINEDRLNKTFIAANDGMWDWDLVTDEVYFDPRYYTMAGYDVDEFPHNFEEFQKRVHPNDINRVMANAQGHLQGKLERFHVEFRFLKKDGSWLWILGRGVIVERDEHGRPLRFIGTHSDVSVRKRIEEKLLQNASFNEALLNAIPTPVFFKDREGRYQGCNPAFTEIMGVKNDDLCGKTVFDLWPSEHADEYHRKDLELMENPKHQVYEYKIKDKEGNIRPVIYAKNVFRDHQGNVAGIVGAFLDISEQEKIREELRRKKEELEKFFTTSLDLLCIADLNGYFIQVNKEWEKILGYGVEELQERKFLDFVHPDDVEATLGAMKDLGQNKEVLSLTNRYRTKSGGYRYIEWRSTPQDNLIYAAARDVTERIQAEKLIREKNKELENYLYVASHDLRSPLVNIQGFTSRLNKHLLELEKNLFEKGDEDKIYQHLESLIKEQMPKSMDFIFTNVKKMDVLINGLLQISRTGRSVLSISRIDMNELMKSIIDAVSYQIEEYKIDLKVEDLPECYGDRNLLNQLFTNLITNSIKYRSRERKALIEIKGMAYTHVVKYYICDNGIGIEEKNLEKIWDVFFRVGELSEESGEGIGLSIVKRIIDKHNGNIEVKSEPGKGTKMIVTLPKENFIKE
ncbi:MAG: PAS domain S-box protein [Candidatus Marinimicrobia bacterium]|nr:PAS domain S-box protein [Candidatus Neomarinimicrobiota bacterium]